MSKKRTLPNWLKQQKTNVNQALDNILKPPNSDEPEKRRLRSNYSFADEDDSTANSPQVDISHFDYVKYDGDIIYASDFVEVAEACDQIIQFVEKREESKVPLGFDMEWTFNWKSGPEKTTVIQICTTLDKCYVLHLVNLKKIPQALTVLLHHEKVLLHGVNIKNDIRKLERDFPQFNSNKIIENNCLDLGTWFNEIFVSSGRWSLERLALQVCNLRISKDRKIRMSKWHIFPLTDEQKLYAAIDVYISQLIYQEIEKRKIEESSKYENYFKVYGEEESKTALKADEIKDEIADLLK